MNSVRRTAIFGGIAVLACISLISGCSAQSDPNQSQTESEQNSNAQEGEYSTSGKGGSSSGAGSGASEGTSVVAVDLDGFAVWSRGRLAVSSGGDDDKLLFEVDPETGRTRAWTSLEVDGSVIVAGTVMAESLSSLGSVIARDLSATSADIGEIEADRARVVTVEGDSADFDSISVAEAVLAALNSRSASISELQSSRVDAGQIDAGSASLTTVASDLAELGTLSSRSASLGSVYATHLNAMGIDAAGLSADSAEFGSLYAADGSLERASVGELTSGSISSNRADIVTAAVSTLDVESLKADILSVGIASISSLTAGSLQVGSLNAETLQAGLIDGTLSALEVSAEHGGVVAIPEVAIPTTTDDGSGSFLVSTITVSVPGDTDFVIACGASAPNGYTCMISAYALSGNEWCLTASFPASEVERMLNNGLQVTPAVEVSWLAVDLV